MVYGLQGKILEEFNLDQSIEPLKRLEWAIRKEFDQEIPASDEFLAKCLEIILNTIQLILDIIQKMLDTIQEILDTIQKILIPYKRYWSVLNFVNNSIRPSLFPSLSTSRTKTSALTPGLPC